MKSAIHKRAMLVTVLAMLLAMPGTAAAITAAPASVDFGDVRVDTTESATVAIIVDDGYRIGSHTIVGDFGFDWGTCSSSGEFFVGFGLCNVKVSFSPTTGGDASGSLQITEVATDGTGSTHTVTIALTGRGYAFAATPTSLDFGNVPVNTTATRDVTVTVDAGYALYGVSTIDGDQAFGLDWDSCTVFRGPGTCTVKVRLTPGTTDDFAAHLILYENPVAGGGNRNVIIDLAGHGVENISPTTTASATSGKSAYTFGAWTHLDVIVQLTATDNADGSGVARTEYSLDGGTTWVVYTVPFGVSEGEETILQFRSIDNVGNVESVQSAMIRIDKAAPTGSISVNGGNAYTDTASVTLTLTGNDGAGGGVSKMRLADTGGGLSASTWEDYEASRSYTLPSGDGTKTVYVQFQDAAGNVSLSYSDEIVLDAAKPTISAAVSGGTPGANGWYTSAVTVRFTCSDGGSGIPAAACPDDQILNAEGASVSSTVQTVTDAAGNVSDPSNIVTVKIDRTAPTVAITAPRPDSEVQDGFTFTATLADGVSGPDTLYFSVRSDDGSSDGTSVGFEKLSATRGSVSGGQATFSLSFQTAHLPDGYYLLVAEGYDGADNLTSTSATIHFKIVNLALVELLPATGSNNAGRTMPVKFSLLESSTGRFVENQQLTIKIRQGSSSILQSSTFGTAATDYRIDKAAALYITNFQTRKTPTTYVVEVWRETATSALLVSSFEFATVK